MKKKRNPEKAVKRKKSTKAKVSDGKKKKPIKHLEGNNHILVIAPHGVMGDDNNTNIVAEELHEKFGCYAVINVGYTRPDKDKGEKSNPDAFILDLARIADAEKLRGKGKERLEDNDFLGWIDQFTKKIIKNGDNPLVLHIHGIDDDNIEKVEAIADDYTGKPGDLGILIGYGQWKKGVKKLLTAEAGTIKTLIHSMRKVGINAIKAPTEPIQVNGEDKYYCGRSTRRLNQYLRKNGIKVQSIQLEIKKAQYREDKRSARKTANHLGKVSLNLEGGRDKSRVDNPLAEMADVRSTVAKPSESAKTHLLPDPIQFRTALSKNFEVKEVRVTEIDLSDAKFKSRTSEYGIDQKKFDELVSSIIRGGIHHNLLLRKLPDRKKYQLISGFRRLSALEEVYKRSGNKDDIPNAPVWAKIFDSLTDEGAHEISFSENLAREDLSLWEMANSCRKMKENHGKERKSMGDIESHIAEMIGKDARTVRRYLRISRIKSEYIRKDLHNGSIDISIATILVKEGFTEEDRGALHVFYNKNPMASRQFDEIAQNLLKLKDWSGLNVKRIMDIHTAKDFLSIDPDELKKRVEYLTKMRNKSIVHILLHEMKDLKKPIDTVKSNDHFALFLEGFSKKSKSLEKKMTEVFKTKKVPGDLTIEPGRDLEKKIVKLTVSAPATDIPKMINLTAKELKDDFASLAKLFQKAPSLPTQKVSTEKVKIDKNTTIAFAMPLEELQSVLRTLNKNGVPTDESKGQILVRTLPNNKIQFGCINHNGLLIEKETEVYREGSVGLVLSDIYTPIINLKVGKNTECVVTGRNTPPDKKGKKGILSISVKSMNLIMDFSTYRPNELIKYYDEHLPPKPLVKIDATDLKQALNKVLTCINPREVRRSLTGILFKIDKKNLTIAGINGFKCFEMVKPHGTVSVSEGELIVSFYTGKLLKEILQKEAGNVRIGVIKNVIYFQIDTLLVIGKLLLNQEYPDYRKMFIEADNSFRVPIFKLRQMASSISTIADPENNHRMTIKSGNNLVVFQNEKGMVECYIDNVKGKFDIDVNAMFLAELANIMGGEEAEVRYITGNNYITFHPDEDSQRALLTTVKRRSDDNQSESKPKKAETYGTREWAVYSVNCCNGCSHDCVYCYGKFMACRRPEGRGRIPIDKWKEEKVRQKDVVKGYRKREGRIMFPSAHDITPSNFKACYTVLEKLLEAGNEVLVVSKPHFECIKPICDGLAKFKDKILFRFTIGAKNDGILSIWEPNSPSYEERKRCLNNAFDSGYKTSVSVEPMLDSENIDSLIEDLMPLVSDAIWVGKMNHIGRIISNNGDLKEEITKIKESQSDDKIKAIYERHKENPKIKWKESIKKVVGIAPVEKPGMDI